MSILGDLDKLSQEWQGEKTIPGDYIRSLESGLPSRERNKRWIVALQAYMDASGMGSIKKDPHLVIAGFVSISGLWADFSDAWKAELDNPPSIAYFKCNEAFYPRYGQFKGWKQQDIDNKITALIKVIRSYKLIGRVCSYIDKHEFNSLIIKELPKRRIDNPYFLCFQHVIFNIISRQSKYKRPIDFIFDEEEKLGDDCVMWFNYFKNYIAPKRVLPCYGSIIFGDDKRIMPLQAADLYAGLFRRHLFENKVVYMSMSNELKSLQKIPKVFQKQISLKDMSLYIQREEIRDFLKRKVKGGLTHII
jgi:hypothetical protein